MDGENYHVCEDGCLRPTEQRIPGEYLFLPRGIPHGIRVTGSTPTTMLMSFSVNE
jgi:quercetin dioxygenase-like cupin family protein